MLIRISGSTSSRIAFYICLIVCLCGIMKLSVDPTKLKDSSMGHKFKSHCKEIKSGLSEKYKDGLMLENCTIMHTMDISFSRTHLATNRERICLLGISGWGYSERYAGGRQYVHMLQVSEESPRWKTVITCSLFWISNVLLYMYYYSINSDLFAASKRNSWVLNKCRSPVLYIFLCHLQSIAAHRDHFVRRLSVCLSGSHTFLVVMHSYVAQATYTFLGMLSLFLLYWIVEPDKK